MRRRMEIFETAALVFGVPQMHDRDGNLRENSDLWKVVQAYNEWMPQAQGEMVLPHTSYSAFSLYIHEDILIDEDGKGHPAEAFR